MNRFARPENFGHPVRTPLLREHFVYRAFDAHGDLLYVGCSVRPKIRLSEHRSTSQWFGQMARLRIAGPFNYETAREIERDAIHNERPLHNYTPERRAWDKAQDRLCTAYMDHYVTKLGMPWPEALEVAVDKAREVIGYPGGNVACRIDDLTLPAVRRRLAAALSELEVA